MYIIVYRIFFLILSKLEEKELIFELLIYYVISKNHNS